MTVSSLSAAAIGNAEVELWKSRIGSSFQHQNAELVLQSVDATDRSADPARPRDLRRTHEIAMLFLLKRGTVADTDCHRLDIGADSHDLHLKRVMAPRGEVGEYYEAILN